MLVSVWLRNERTRLDEQLDNGVRDPRPGDDGNAGTRLGHRLTNRKPTVVWSANPKSVNSRSSVCSGFSMMATASATVLADTVS